MPIYEFSKLNSKKIYEFFFTSDSAPKIGSEIEIEGIKYIRIPSFLQARVDSISKIDPTDAQKFVEITGKKSGTYGSLLDESARLSQERIEKYGKDGIGENFQKQKDKKMEDRKTRNQARKQKDLIKKSKENK